jgi:hypothetical protein
MKVISDENKQYVQSKTKKRQTRQTNTNLDNSEVSDAPEKKKRAPRKKAVVPETGSDSEPVSEPVAEKKKRAPRKKAVVPETGSDSEPVAEKKKRAPRKKAVVPETGSDSETVAEPVAEKKKRAPRKKAVSEEPVAESEPVAEKKKRAPRKKAAAEPEPVPVADPEPVPVADPEPVPVPVPEPEPVPVVVSEVKQKLCTITFMSNYRGHEKEKVEFGPEEESKLVKEILHWMITENKGFSIDAVRDTMMEEGEMEEDGELEEDGEMEDSDFDDEKMITKLAERCNTTSDLRKICKNYGDSYFESKDGWKLKIVK